MNITVKTNSKDFYLYGIDFVPQQGDKIIKDDNIYEVVSRIWDEDNSETIINVKLVAKRVSEQTDLDIIQIAKSGKVLEAVKLYKEAHGVLLKEAKEWVDAHL